MLFITIPETEIYNNKTNEFSHIKEHTLKLEHSLISLSKWESKWCKPFLKTVDKSIEEMVDYIRCMTITQNVDPLVYECLTDNNIRQIDNYINSPMTATTFSGTQKGRTNRETITSELLYHWMIELHIPFECEKWHLNRLITLIQLRAIKSQPQKKMSRNEILRRNAEINAARRKRLNSKG